jgi:hypothetical protein
MNKRFSAEEVKLITWDITLSTVNDNSLIYDSAAWAFTVTIPAASLWATKFAFKFRDVTNLITFATTGGDTIETIVPVLNASYTIQSDWVNHWMIVWSGSW